jgi:flotillin
VAKETLEGNLRGALASLTPEQVNQDRKRFVEELFHDAEPDLEKLGLHLDTLKIQSITDDRDYLNSIGRKRIAEIIQQAEVAESSAMKSAEEVEAKEQGRSEVARRDAQTEIQKRQNELRRMLADLEREAKSEEEKANGLALAARAEAEQELQRVRTDLEALRLQADVVIPAEAQKIARELIAAGEAAEIAERGRAMAEVLRMMTEIWREAGDAALDVFILQRMEHIMKEVADAARRVQVMEVALIDSGDGRALPNYVSSFPAIVSNIFGNLRDTVGLDVGGALVGKGSAGGPGSGSAMVTPRPASPSQPAFEPGVAPARAIASDAAAGRSAQTIQTVGLGAEDSTAAPRSSTFAALQRRMQQQRQQANPDGSDET